MSDRLGTLLATCQSAGMAAACLLLPAALMDWAFGTELIGILAQGTLVAFACALIVAIWRYQNP